MGVGRIGSLLKTESILDELPFLLDPEGRYDVSLDRYFLWRHGRDAIRSDDAC
jgi:hypothetical protein